LTNRNSNFSANQLSKSLFIIYLLALLWILLLKLGVQFSYMKTRSVNLIPFGQPMMTNGKPDFSEVVLNVLVFIPLGIYAGMLFRKWTFIKKLFFFFSVSLVLEALQFILKIGAFDITDLIANSSGAVIGLMTFYGIVRLFNNSIKAQKFINVVAAIGTVLVISLLLLLKLNMLPVRYQ
jgi:glycopeptide antibiotics resistance protein